jgi:acyl dehydratase
MPKPVLVELKVGDIIGQRTVSLERASMVKYAGASGDFNIIHWNDRAANEAGLPGVIAHGMLTMGVAINFVAEWCGDPGRIIEYSTRFAKMVPVPDPGTADLDIKGVIGAIEGDEVRIDLTVQLQDTKVLAKTQAVVRL